MDFDQQSQFKNKAYCVHYQLQSDVESDRDAWQDAGVIYLQHGNLTNADIIAYFKAIFDNFNWELVHKEHYILALFSIIEELEHITGEPLPFVDKERRDSRFISRWRWSLIRFIYSGDDVDRNQGPTYHWNRVDLNTGSWWSLPMIWTSAKKPLT